MPKHLFFTHLLRNRVPASRNHSLVFSSNPFFFMAGYALVITSTINNTLKFEHQLTNPYVPSKILINFKSHTFMFPLCPNQLHFVANSSQKILFNMREMLVFGEYPPIDSA